MDHETDIPDLPVAWRPDPAKAGTTRFEKFLDRHGFPDLDALQAEAARDPGWFWQTVVEEELAVPLRRQPTSWVDGSQGVPWTRFLVGARLNLEDALLDRHAAARPGATALIWEGEDGEVRSFSYAAAKETVDRLRHGLMKLGLRAGDRVGVYLPMLPETVFSVLALASAGLVFVPIFSGYGAKAVATRLADAGARALITADGFLRRARRVDMLAEARQAAIDAGTEHVIVVTRVGGSRLSPREIPFGTLLEAAPDGASPTLDAEDPLMVIYTSGTTGRPKGALHVQAGFPLKAAQDLAHAFDLGQEDTLFWFTDMGWMMGPWEVYGSFLHGSTLVIYEGSPDHPAPDRLWALVERHGVTHLGVSPTAIRSLMGQGDHFVTSHDLSSLRILGSTGEPWNVAPWLWFSRLVGGGRCPIVNYSGGTETSGGILAAYPHLPQKPCAFTGPLPGMQAAVLDTDGRPVTDAVGELSLLSPWLGMTRGFWNDRGRYLESYWSTVPDVWVHGDFALHTADGFWYILGRSDDTIKVAGKRLGPAEAESAAVSHAAVSEAVAIGRPHPVKGEALVLFVVTRPGHEPSDDLRREIVDRVAAQLGKALRPEAVYFVTELPHTRNGKILRRLVRTRHLGLPPGDIGALENPSALTAIDEAR